MVTSLCKKILNLPETVIYGELTAALLNKNCGASLTAD
jgi:hypothetical protein